MVTPKKPLEVFFVVGGYPLGEQIKLISILNLEVCVSLEVASRGPSLEDTVYLWHLESEVELTFSH